MHGIEEKCQETVKVFSKKKMVGSVFKCVTLFARLVLFHTLRLFIFGLNKKK